MESNTPRSTNRSAVVSTGLNGPLDIAKVNTVLGGRCSRGATLLMRATIADSTTVP